MLSDDEINIYNIVHSSQEIVAENEDKTVDSCWHLTKIKSKTNHDAVNPIKMHNGTPMKYNKFMMNSPSKFNDEIAINISVPKIAHVTNISTKPLQRTETTMKSIESSEMKDSISNRTGLVYLILFRI